ncbi:MAG: bifunctional hydroxymethylpyrimidine kinase/phosphomethylpyrimidine kinase [Haloferacaceae archaeon]
MHPDGTRRRAPVTPPVALTIAGSDSGGGAGVQADLKTMEAHDAFGTSVVTAVTAQNTRGVAGSHVLPAEQVRAQYRAVAEDFDVRAVKTGMLATRPVIEAVTDLLGDYGGPVVVDPVMVAASGDRLLTPDAEAAYGDLLADATLVTPNADEAEVLTGVDVRSPEDAREAGEALVATGVDAALVKGGHLGGDRVVDTLVTDDGVERFEHARVDTDATHGSGCTLSSAVAARLAHGESVRDAVAAGTSFMARAVRYGLDVGEGPGSVHHLVDLRDAAAREPTTEAVERVLATLVERDVSPLVPEVGMNVVGATPYAEAVGDVAAVEGRISRTLAGVATTRGVRMGASSHVARFLLSAREFVPDLRFGANVRFDDAVEAALDEAELGGPVAEFDRGAEPEDAPGTMDWGAARAFADADEPPVAVFDRGAVGKEPMVRLVARDADAVRDRVLALLTALDDVA